MALTGPSRAQTGPRTPPWTSRSQDGAYIGTGTPPHPRPVQTWSVTWTRTPPAPRLVQGQSVFRLRPPLAPPLTTEVVVAGGPGLGAVEVGVSADVGPREVGVGQEAAFSVEGGAVPVEALGEEDHDVRLGRPALPHLPVGHLPEAQRGGGCPHAESPTDGPERPGLPHLGGVVLDAGGEEPAPRAHRPPSAPPPPPRPRQKTFSWRSHPPVSTVSLPEGDLLVFPLHALDGVAPAPHVGLDFCPELVRDTAAGATHGPVGLGGRGVRRGGRTTSKGPPSKGLGGAWRTYKPTADHVWTHNPTRAIANDGWRTYNPTAVDDGWRTYNPTAVDDDWRTYNPSAVDHS